MKAIELEKAYDPKTFEDRIYKMWMDNGLFQPAGDPAKKPFVIVIPPPNVTGILHMGHGLNNSLQDILIRYYRMNGRPTLWVPGMDHAGIATQNVVERLLKKEGKTRNDLGREKFVEKTWEVANDHKKTIENQLAKIGSSCDWSRERFTLDAGLSKAVREVFVTLYERGLIYRGNYLVNWCPSCGTAISDDEVEHEDTAGFMYHLWYELADGPLPGFPEGRIEIATTRPETLLGDTAVAVNPGDERYSSLVGRKVKLPLAGREIPIVADSYVDKDFGTGMVKITPAHDPNDWAVAERQGLEKINILTPDARLNENVPEKYRGLKVAEARKVVIEDLKEAGLYKGETAMTHSVGHCYRCRSVIEPYQSKQWFVKMRPLADKALQAWKDGDIHFYPQRWESTYENWMTNIRDWCISRQLWWGHRIPVWYCKHCGAIIVSREDPTYCQQCGSSEIWQDEDVLDTWFSSWLWPFSTLGWPKDTADLRKYYPTTTLVTGFDIIFFWVARMIMAGLEFMGQVPFRDICMTTLVRDKQGRKMSKSLGNGIDPLEVVDEYGADSLKFTLSFMYTSTQDILIDKESFKLGTKFANKVCNASRYLLMNLEGRTLLDPKTVPLTDADRWIFHRLNEATKTVRASVEGYRFNDAATAVYEFFWNDFCDWYVEITKSALNSSDSKVKDGAVTLLLSILEESLRLMHPFLSFITEEIYQKLPVHDKFLITAKYPEIDPSREAPEAALRFEALQELVRLIRTLRSEFTIGQEKKLRVHVKLEPGFAAADFFRERQDIAKLLANLGEITFSSDKPAGSGTITLVGSGFEAFVFVKEAIDVAQLIAKFEKEIAKDSQFAQRTKAKLTSGGFAAQAPAEIVAREREKLEETERRVTKMREYVTELS
jgi:valyl-tRNA synthetase